MAGTITSANAVLTMTIPNVYNTAQLIQQWAVDDFTDVAEIRTIETMMSIDGFLAAGFVFVPFEQTISLMASSPSCDIFDNWWVFDQQNKEASPCSAQLVLPSIGKRYIFNRGFRSSYPTFAGVGKTLKVRKFGVVWNSIIPSPI